MLRVVSIMVISPLNLPMLHRGLIGCFLLRCVKGRLLLRTFIVIPPELVEFSTESLLSNTQTRKIQTETSPVQLTSHSPCEMYERRIRYKPSSPPIRPSSSLALLGPELGYHRSRTERRLQRFHGRHVPSLQNMK